jgi:vacuolar-type H+-ATPase subunit I/STV1
VFTVDPQLATKRQERLAKNRASAIQARQRKAEHVKHLEQQVELLRTENTMLKDRLQEVESRLREMELEREKELHEITRTTQAWLDERTFQDLENQFLFLDHVTPRTSFAPARETLVFQLLYHKVAAILLLMLVFSAAIISIPFAHRDVIRNDPQDMPSIAMTTEKSLAHVSTDKAVTVHPRFKLHKPIETVE